MRQAWPAYDTGQQGAMAPAVPFWLETQDDTKAPTLRTWLLMGGVAVGGIVVGCLLWRSVQSDNTPVAATSEATLEPATEVPAAVQTAVEAEPTSVAEPPAAVEVTAVAPAAPPAVEINA